VDVAHSHGVPVPECSGSSDVKGLPEPRYKKAGGGPSCSSPTTTMNDNASISRATSISRASKQGSTISRSQSLIKKNIAPQDLRPSDVLIDRFVAWKAIVKQLVAYFEVPFFLQPSMYTANPSHLLMLGYRGHREQHRKGNDKTRRRHPSPIPIRQSIPWRGRASGQHLLPQ
jgi:hypothetical protein